MKLYKIYAKEKCLYQLNDETEFHKKWKELNRIVDLIKSDYKTDDLHFMEETI